MNSLLLPRLVVFGVCVIAFLVGLYFNKRDDKQDKAVYEEEQRRRGLEKEKLELEQLRQEVERQRQEMERQVQLFREQARSSSAAKAMTEESQPLGLGGGAAEQNQGQQPKRMIN